ncbi:Nramp family divalent metal transporter [Gordonia sp. Z-3]|uniref:Nramp family divalent metal transporter n=1 Tax=unclassified Gordonia (in: high G+C Gram-positive bacteria) TaxID=2657482 RepID=UPI000C3F2EE0|nr:MULTISPECIES: Nramp family divalent metal transporter [unclassified Gordonia (in: high G+C Gram-positive bacteria)]MAU83208.1 divalent metal cation transporter [Gordonia sp. (in: high G+C Gram-positive bacteria)]MAU83620.1 divalent metal cation transporter [Gordonia sp. (in: high G+C Gram-positive bacteria)]MED5801359.1 Nramp family divalent metal transporter [Gordonia sp. Z-3]
MALVGTRSGEDGTTRKRVSRTRKNIVGNLALFGPAFVAAIAYVDPGNVAANITAGARYGFLLVWVLVLANVIAMLIQYQSAKLGIVTGKSLPGLLGDRLSTRPRLAFWVQAEVVAIATDLAEVLGGAVALQLLFDLPLVLGGVIVGAVSLTVLLLQNPRQERTFEKVILGLLAIIVIGFLAGLVVDPPPANEVLGGLVPRLDGPETVLLAAGMLGATVMPHAIYVHSAMVIDRHGVTRSATRQRQLVRVTRWDVVVALIVAGAVNVALLLLAAQNLRGKEGTDTIEGAYDAVADALGSGMATAFAIGLLASGLASTSVGSSAGAAIMGGLLHRDIPLFIRRVITVIPALVVLALGVDPTWALVISQVVLSFGIPFAVIPLGRFTADRSLMGEFADGWPLRLTAGIASVLIVLLNLTLIGLVVTGA